MTKYDITIIMMRIALRVIGENKSIETVLRSTDSQSAQTSIHHPLVTTSIKKANILRKQIYLKKYIVEEIYLANCRTISQTSIQPPLVRVAQVPQTCKPLKG